MGEEPKLFETAAREITKAFQTLLTEKYLYQAVSVDLSQLPRIAALSAPPKPPASIENVRRPALLAGGEVLELAYKYVNSPWAFNASSQGFSMVDVNALASKGGGLFFPLTALNTIRVPCDVCDAILPPHHFEGTSWGEESSSFFWLEAKDEKIRAQDLCLTFRCQSCLPEKAQPVTFLVHREGLKIRLVGRSRLQKIEVPSFVPKEEASYLREVEIAQKAGKGLAAIFYLRVFIEQHMRRITGLEGQVTGDELGTGYAKHLPADYPKGWPSFRTHYEKLSVAIHSAKDSPEMLRDVLDAVIRHFKYLEMFPLI